MKHNLLILLSFLIPVVVPEKTLGQNRSPEPFSAVKAGSPKALYDLLGTEKKGAEWDDLFRKHVLPNPFQGNPDHDLDLWYRHQSAFHYRPEVGAFLYCPPGTAYPPPTLCVAPIPDAEHRMSNQEFDGEQSFSDWTYQEWENFCPPLICGRIHRLLSVPSNPPDSLIRLLDILSRWDPGEATLTLIDYYSETAGIAQQTVSKWKNRIYLSAGSEQVPSIVQFHLPLDQLRSDQYQSLFSVYPFIYDEPVDFYGRVLTTCHLAQVPPWAPIYDLLKTHHPRSLYYLAARAYHNLVDNTPPDLIHYRVILRQMTGLDIQSDDLDSWLLHFYTSSADWVWSDQLQRFSYYPEMEDHLLLVESWFRHLASPDPNVASSFYKLIIDADPAIVRQHSGDYRQMLTQWNPALPPANLPFPEITSSFRSDARNQGERLLLSPGIAELAKSLLFPLPMTQRIRIEDSLMQVCSAPDATALEALALEWVANPSAEYSLSRIIDHLYRSDSNPFDYRSILRKTGLFLQGDRGDAASRYIQMLEPRVDLPTTENWMVECDDDVSREALRQIQKQRRLEEFIIHPEQIALADLVSLPEPDIIPQEDWRMAIVHLNSNEKRLRFIQYFQLFPREFQTGELLSSWIPNPESTEKTPTDEALVRLLEYVSGLYNLENSLDWWKMRWIIGKHNWPGLTGSICTDFITEFQASGVIDAHRFGFILRHGDQQMIANLPSWREIVSGWEDPGQIRTLRLENLSVQQDLPFLIESGLAPDLLAGMSSSFDLTDLVDEDLYLHTLFTSASAEGTLPEVTNRLFNHIWVRTWLTQPAQQGWRQTIQENLQLWLNESPWISAYEEANTWAQLIWCQSSGDPSRWLDLLLKEDRDPGLQRQILALLCRDLELDGLHILLRQLDEMSEPGRTTLMDQVLQTFALPPLDGHPESTYRAALLNPRGDGLKSILNEALTSLSPSFAPPTREDLQEDWMATLCSREYVRPLFGYHPAPRMFPVATALTWWICQQSGEESAIQALKLYRQSGDITELVRAADLQLSIISKSGINSLFDPR